MLEKFYHLCQGLVAEGDEADVDVAAFDVDALFFQGQEGGVVVIAQGLQLAREFGFQKRELFLHNAVFFLRGSYVLALFLYFAGASDRALCFADVALREDFASAKGAEDGAAYGKPRLQQGLRALRLFAGDGGLRADVLFVEGGLAFGVFEA